MLNFPNSPTVGQVFAAGPSWAWDGVKWQSVADSALLNVVTPVSGSTIVIPDKRPVWVDNVAVLAALTIRLPLGPTVGDLTAIGFLSPVTALSMQDAAGIVLPTGPTSAYGPGAALYFRYINVTRGWVYWK